MSHPPAIPLSDAHWARMIQECAGTAPAPRPAGALHAATLPPRLLPPVEPGPPSERERLRARLPAVVRLLARRRADLLSEAEVARLVALDWLEWHGGTLRLTTVGRNLCDALPVAEH